MRIFFAKGRLILQYCVYAPGCSCLGDRGASGKLLQYHELPPFRFSDPPATCNGKPYKKIRVHPDRQEQAVVLYESPLFERSLMLAQESERRGQLVRLSDRVYAAGHLCFGNRAAWAKYDNTAN